MITSVSVENFKGVREPVEFELKPITLLFGANSAGKSTLIHAIHYARELLERRNLNADQTVMGGEVTRLGGFRNLVHKHDLSKPVTIRVTVSDFENEIPSFSEGNDSISAAEDLMEIQVERLHKAKEVGVELEIRWSHSENEARVTRYETFIDGMSVARLDGLLGRKSHTLSLNLEHPCFLSAAEAGVSVTNAQDEITEVAFSGDDDVEMDVVAVFPQIARNMQQWGMLPNLLPSSEYGDADSLGMEVQVGEDVFPRLDDPIEGYSITYAELPRTTRQQRLELFEEDVTEECVYGEEPRWWELSFRSTVSELVCGIGQLVRSELSKAVSIGPVRQAPDHTYQTPTFDIPGRWATGLAAWDFLYKTEALPFVDEISQWLCGEDCLDAGYRIEARDLLQLDGNSALARKIAAGRHSEIEEGDCESTDWSLSRSVVILPSESDEPVLKPQDVGEGISQVLPVIVASMLGTGSFVGIEQPELHVHPRLQASLGDLFIETLNTHGYSNYLLETHSEHLILRLLRRIRETGKGSAPDDRSLTHDDLAIYYVEQIDSSTSIRRIDVDSNGDFVQAWPDDFFELDFKERFA